MLLKGLLVVIGGFVFIFASGIPMRLISRLHPDYKREGLYWGIVIWIVAFFLSGFIQNLIRQFVTGGQKNTQSANLLANFSAFLAGTILTTLLVQVGMLIYLRILQKKNEDLISAGLALGFGIGLIAQVFTGLILIGVGAGIAFSHLGVDLGSGTIQVDTINTIANDSLLNLFVALSSLILYRVSLLTISAAQGFMIARSIKGKGSWFWFALVVYTLFSGVIFALQVLFGEQNPGQVSLGITSPAISIVTVIYYLIIIIFSYKWLTKELQFKLKKK